MPPDIVAPYSRTDHWIAGKAVTPSRGTYFDVLTWRMIAHLPKRRAVVSKTS
jgi:hypothetical protein